jgi:two-component system sensor histidine kinase PfeS
MSQIADEDKATLRIWGQQAETLYLSGDKAALETWLSNMQKQEDIWMAIAATDIERIAGDKEKIYVGYSLGRNMDWNIHLHFGRIPVIQILFGDERTSLLTRLPERMMPGTYWQYAKVTLQFIIPFVLLIFLSYMLYRYIMSPLMTLQRATRAFSKGDFDVSAKKMMGNRNDEFSDLAITFDKMAQRIGEQIINQRQLISDLSHELRTPLTRLDIALEKESDQPVINENIERITRESKQIRKLVEDTLTFAWLENEKPELQQESLDLVDLVDVLIEDARFEFPDRNIVTQLPDSALIKNSSHRAAGQALENVLRNALRYTPEGKKVSVSLTETEHTFQVLIIDQGPGVPEQYLKKMFKPFFKVDSSRANTSDNFGLGLALAKRQLAAVRATVTSENIALGGLLMTIEFPKR